VSCGYVRRYHSVYVWSYILQSVILSLHDRDIHQLILVYSSFFPVMIGVSQMQSLKRLAALYV
jgi:hypothetical protein